MVVGVVGDGVGITFVESDEVLTEVTLLSTGDEREEGSTTVL